MRVLTLVEAVVALGVGALGGLGLLYGTGELKTSAQLSQLRADYDNAFQSELSRLESERRVRLEAEEEANRRIREAEARARAEAEAEAQAARLKAEAERARAEAAPKLPAYGQLVLKAATDLEVDGGAAGGGRGKSIDLAFDTAPSGRIRVKGGKFTINLTPKLRGSRMTLDVSVSPMAIIAADGERKGVSTAQDIAVGRQLRLDFQSPAAGDLNLVLAYRR